MNQVFAPFDAATIGPDLVTERADTIIFASEDGTSNERRAISLFGQDAYDHDVEFLFWAPAGGGGVVGVAKLFAGIAVAGERVDRYVGQTAFSYGLRLDTGQVYCNGVVVATFAPVALDVIVRVSLSVDGSRCRWYAGDTLLGEVVIPAGYTWHYAATVSGGSAGSIQCYANAGQQLLAASGKTTDGWWQALPQIPPLRLATHACIGAPDGATPHERFGRGLSITSTVKNSRGVTFWTDGEAGSGSDVGQLDVIDHDGLLIPALLNNDVRDLDVEVVSIDPAAPSESPEMMALGVVESFEVTSDETATLILRDRMAQLDAPAQRRLVLPNAEASAVDQPWPLLIGCARSIPGKLINEATRDNAFADQPMGNIGLLRNNGKAVDPDLWELTNDGQRILFDEDLQGAITIDASANGQFSPGSYTDQLGGVGHFEAMTGTGGIIAAWVRGGGAAQGGASNAAFWPVWANYGNGIGRCEFKGSATSYTAQSWIATPTNVIKAGRSYRAKLFIEYIPGVDDRGIQSFLVLTGRPYMGGPAGEWKRFQNDALFATLEYPDYGVNEAVFHNAEDVDLPFAIQMLGGVNDEGRVRWVELYELPAAGDEIDLEGVSLAEFCRRAIEDLRGLPASTWSRADAKVIDDATGYQYGTHVGDAITTRELVQQALRSCSAALAPRSNGTTGIVRLIDPDLVPDADVDFWITPRMLLGDPTVKMDRAMGLSNRAQCRRNIAPASDGDFGDDFDPGTGVTMATRRILTADYQITVVSAVQLAPCYRQALSGAPLQTIFDRRADAQKEIDRVCLIYAKRRYYMGQQIDWQNHRFEDGQVVGLTFAYQGWPAGKKLLVKTVDDAALDSVSLNLWG